MQPPSGGCVLKQTLRPPSRLGLLAAAFGRLCVETFLKALPLLYSNWQPPSGGCVLKQNGKPKGIGDKMQPPSGGCVLKQIRALDLDNPRKQPPSGGCVLKLCSTIVPIILISAAAFGRLCVETGLHQG